MPSKVEHELRHLLGPPSAGLVSAAPAVSSMVRYSALSHRYRGPAGHQQHETGDEHREQAREAQAEPVPQ